ncbi:MAG: hypothetical protein AUI15_41895 [Actinobacteria bacterium 13_2_20CM_2_66_6]|nr:MAG: hypothetical protein AUI15_41895 [Actinobacteria bacterium 13_2_20CM_2_66_6]
MPVSASSPSSERLVSRIPARGEPLVRNAARKSRARRAAAAALTGHDGGRKASISARRVSSSAAM